MKPRAKDMAKGRWRSVLSQLGIPDAVLDGKHHPCPSTGEGQDRFRFADRNGSGNYFCACSGGEKGGMALVMCHKGVDYAEAARLVESVVGQAQETPEKPRRDPREALNRIRQRLKPVGPEVARYLKGRGLTVPPGLKQTRLTYWDKGEKVGVFDCMVGLIQSHDDRPQSYHITYLKNGRKAPVEDPKKVMTPVDTITGAAVRLYPAAPEMGVAEGIETAIAASILFGVPVWAALNANSLAEFTPPSVCEQLTVFGDRDRSYHGQWAAYKLANRMVRAGLECGVVLPDRGDWNDVLNEKQAADHAAAVGESA